MALKLTALLTIIILLQTAVSGFGQTVTFNAKATPLATIFKAIKKQTGYAVFYRNDEITGLQPVTVTLNKTPLTQTLEMILADQPLRADIQGNTIVISRKTPVIRPSQTSTHITAAGTIPVSGTVSDAKGVPLMGVNILIKGGRTGTVSDANGRFEINVQPGQSIVFSFVSYETQEYKIPASATSNPPVTLILTKKESPLDDVQVIAYGTTTRRFATGSVSSVTSTDISRQTIDNPLEALQGRIAGMQLTQDNGLPGSDIRVSIRGAGSTALYNSGYMPLYIIDGVPFTLYNGSAPPTDALNAYGVVGANGNMSPFSMINPADIERIDVLKDADATAIYGSRGANGVVMITTKKSNTRAATNLTLNAYQGIKKVGHFIDMMNTQQYLAMRREAFANAGQVPTTANAKDLTVWDTTKYTNWEKYFIGGTAKTTNATLSLSGGNAQNSFLLSSTYRNEGTVFPGNYSTLNFSNRLNAGHTSADNKFNVNVSVNYSYMSNNFPTQDLSTLLTLPPNYPIYNSDGTANWTLTNPLAYLQRPFNSATTNFISNLNLKYTILPGLDLRANLGYTLTSQHQTSAMPLKSQNPATSTTLSANLNYGDNYINNYIVEPQATYARNIGKGRLDAVIGTTFQQTKATGVTLNGKGYTNDALITSLTSASSVQVFYNNYSVYKYNAGFARVNYNWEDRYILDGTFRRDGSSRFGPEHKFGNFGAVGAAWIFSNEDFIKDHVSFLSYGKLRGSYGVTGNDQIPNYLYYPTAASGSSTYAYQGTSIYTQSTIANPDLHWEATKKLDVALALGFFTDRVLINVDYYRNRSANRLVPVTLPAQSTGLGYTANLPSSVQNKGWEIELTTTNVRSKDFRWTTSINLSINRNKLLSYPNLENTTYRSVYILGKPMDITQLYHFTGIDPQTGQPGIQSLTGTPNYYTDRVVAPYGHPYFGGIYNSISYKDFQLTFGFQFNHRMGSVNNTLSLPFGGSYLNQNTSVLDRWKQPKDVTNLPLATTVSSTALSYYSSSDFNWGDASFIKFKTLSLSYSLPQRLVQKMKLRQLSVFAQGQNLFTWAKQKYTLDPEGTAPGTSPGLGTGAYIAMPQLRSMVLGINCSL